MKRLTVRLPEEHWIWEYPSGERGQKIREALNFMGDLGSYLESIEERLSQIEEKLSSGVHVEKEPQIGESNKGSQKVKIDFDAFQNL